MNDEQLDNLKKFMDSFTDLDNFKWYLKFIFSYDDKQIDQLIDVSIGILKQLRFGLYDKYAEKKNNR